MIFDLRSDLYSHIQLLPLRWFDNRATGDLMTRMLEDVNSVERVLIDGIEQGRRRGAAGRIVLGGVMFYFNVKLTLVALAPAAVPRRAARSGTRSPRIAVIGCNGAPRRP